MSTDSQDEDALPVRAPRSSRGGRHRRSQPLATPTTGSPLVLAVPGARRAAYAETITEIGSLTGADYPGTSVRVGYLEGDEANLATVLADLDETQDEGAPAAVVVPLIAGPDPQVSTALQDAVTASGVSVTFTDPLGPHPLLAEALHVRLAEAGLARADRIRLLSVITAADGVIVVTTGGAEAVQAAGITAVLLASRLAVPVVPAALGETSGGTPGVSDAVAQLREAGASRPALAPCLIGPEAGSHLLADAAAEIGAECAEPLGAHPAVAKLVSLRYGNVL